MTGDAPSTFEWSTISLPSKVCLRHLIVSYDLTQYVRGWCIAKFFTCLTNFAFFQNRVCRIESEGFRLTCPNGSLTCPWAMSNGICWALFARFNLTRWDLGSLLLIQVNFNPIMDKYRKTSNINCTLVGNKIVDNSDVVGASPVGAAPTTSSFSTSHLASMNWAKTTARGYKKHLSFGIWCVLYKGFYGNCMSDL